MSYRTTRNQRLHVLFVFHDDQASGGATLSNLALVRELRSRGHCVYGALRADSTQELRNQANQTFDEVLYVPGRWDCRIPKPSENAAVLGLKRLVFGYENRRREDLLVDFCRRHSVDIVHIGSSVLSGGLEAARRTGAKSVIHVREFGGRDHGLEWFPWVDRGDVLSQADGVICVSEALQRELGTFNNRTRVIYNGVADGASPHDPYEPGSPFRLLFVGGTKPTKGLPLLLEAMSQLPSTTAVTLDVFGSSRPDDLAAAKEFCESHGLSNVAFHGFCRSLQQEYATHDALVMASTAEAFGRVTAEAMLDGCLVIGSDSGGTSELLRDGRGLLFRPEDAAGLAKAIFAAATMPLEERTAILSDAREFAEGHFTLDVYASEVLDFYNDLLETTAEMP